MNDDFLRKITATTRALDKVKKITDLAVASAPLSAIDLAIQRSLSYHDPMIDVISKSSLALNAKYFEPVKFNPVMAVFGSVTQMMYQMQIQQPVYNPINPSILDIINSFTTQHNKAISPLLGISQITSKLLNDVKFETFNWRETYPDLFTKEQSLEYSNEYSKFNENLDNLMDLSIVDEDSTLSDGVVVSVNLDAHADVTVFIPPATEAIFSIANQVFEQIKQENIDYAEVLNQALHLLDKFLQNPYTVNLVSGILILVIGNYYNKNNKVNEAKITQIATTHEIILTEQQVTVKERGEDKSKTIDILPIGVEIEVNKRNPKWTKIIYTKNYVPQIGYCRNEDLKVSK